MTRTSLSLPAELYAPMLTTNVPACVGFPKMSPVVAFPSKPGASTQAPFK